MTGRPDNGRLILRVDMNRLAVLLAFFLFVAGLSVAITLGRSGESPAELQYGSTGSTVTAGHL